MSKTTGSTWPEGTLEELVTEFGTEEDAANLTYLRNKNRLADTLLQELHQLVIGRDVTGAARNHVLAVITKAQDV